MKSKSLPTLELLAVYAAYKCLLNLLKVSNLKINTINFGIDSQIVISWILNGKVKVKNIFANNRIKDIQGFDSQISEESNLKCKLNYVKSSDNPADLLTRGLSESEFEAKFKFWNSGPEFVQNQEIVWPSNDLGCVSDTNKVLISCAAETMRVGSISNDSSVIKIENYSSFSKVLGIVTQIYRVLKKCKKLPDNKLVCAREAWIYLITHEQTEFFKEELRFLQKPCEIVPSRINNLNLFLDPDGIIRCKGRLGRCKNIPYNLANPILISEKSPLTKLLVLKYHNDCKHLGLGSTLNTVRNQGLWIPKSRALVKRVIKGCVQCRRYNTRSFRYPRVTDINSGKVNLVRPFERVGVDYTGHLNVRLGGKFVKMYLLIFTCLSIRAVHIELLPDMQTSSFLAAFTRFVNRYNLPKQIYSDNAPSFSQGARLLNDAFSDDHVSRYLSRNNIRHIKIPLYSAWFGSAWERLIRVVKSCIFKTIGRNNLEYFSLLTLLTDVQNAVNSRPLIHNDTSDTTFEMLTPNSFLKLGSSSNLNFESLAGGGLLQPSASDLIATLLARENLLSNFKDMWYEEYLISLREIDRNTYQPEWENKVKVGELVLISSAVKPRCFWSMGKITKLFFGNDNKVRTVEILRPDGSMGIFAINLLFPLEIIADVVSSHGNQSVDSNPDVSVTEQRPRRPVRAAAVRCLEKIRRS